MNKLQIKRMIESESRVSSQSSYGYTPTLSPNYSVWGWIHEIRPKCSSCFCAVTLIKIWTRFARVVLDVVLYVTFGGTPAVTGETTFANFTFIVVDIIRDITFLLEENQCKQSDH